MLPRLYLSLVICRGMQNAIKFCSGAAGGGKVVVRVSSPVVTDADLPPTRLRSATEAALHGKPGLLTSASCGSMVAPARSCRVLIEVDDNGPGVPSDIAVRLFSPFTQVGVGVSTWGMSLIHSANQISPHATRLLLPHIPFVCLPTQHLTTI